MRVLAVMMLYNSGKTMREALRRLALQSVPTGLILCDNGSTDETDIATDEFRAEMVGMGIRDFRQFTIPQKQIEDVRTRRNKNIEHMLARFAREMEHDPPEAVFVLDSDVIMPPEGLGRLVSEMAKREKLGAIGIDYDVDVGHLRMGCSLYRYAAFKKLAEIGFFSIGCPCRWMHKQLEAMGWEVDTLLGMTAEHRKEGGQWRHE